MYSTFALCSEVQIKNKSRSGLITEHEVGLYKTRNQNPTLKTTDGAGTAYPFGAPEITPGLSRVRVTRSLVLYVCFADRCLSFCTFSFGHCVVCSSSIYGF